MCAKRLSIIICILSMSILAHGFNKESFLELPGKRLASNVIETIIVANKIKCARACKNYPRCKSVNYKMVGNGIECELNSESDSRADLMEDESSTFLCEESTAHSPSIVATTALQNEQPSTTEARSSEMTTALATTTPQTGCITQPPLPALESGSSSTWLTFSNLSGYSADLVRLTPNGNTRVVKQYSQWEWIGVGVNAGSRLYARVQGSENPEIYLMLQSRQTDEKSCYIDVGSVRDIVTSVYDIIQSH